MKKNLNTITFNTDTEINLKYDINGRNKGKVISIGEDTILDEEITYLKIGDHATLIPSGIKYKGTSDNLRYSYDNMGNINKVYVNGELAVRYTYDALNRLIREDNKVFGKTYYISYDNNGNIINKRESNYTLKSDNYLEEILFTNTATNEGMNETNNSEASNEINRNYIDYNYVYDGDKLISIEGLLQITYDNQGRPTTYNGMNLSWDFRNLVSVGNNTFTYDGLGRRISKNNINFTYDSDNRLIKQSNGLEFFYDNTGVAGFIYQSNIYIYRKNLLGDITDIIDSNGNIIVKYVYDAWGNQEICAFAAEGRLTKEEAQNIANINPFRYRGYYYDEETGLFWCNSRYYNPEWGRWISPDSIEYLDPESINGLNLYAYCGNDPINHVDPSGHAWYHWALAAVAAVAVVGLAVCTAGAIVAAAPAVAGYATTLAVAYTGSAALGTVAATAVSIGAATLAVGTVAIGVNEGVSLVSGRNFGSELLGEDLYNGVATVVGMGGYAYMMGGSILPYPSTGNTGSNLNEQLAIGEASSNPSSGKVLTNIKMSDPRMPSWLGWQKYSYSVNGMQVHYVGNRYFPNWYPYSPWFDFKIK